MASLCGIAVRHKGRPSKKRLLREKGTTGSDIDWGTRSIDPEGSGGKSRGNENGEYHGGKGAGRLHRTNQLMRTKRSCKNLG